MPKRYFRINTLENNFPPEFIASKQQKFIVVRYCTAVVNNGEQQYLVGDLELHADFIQRDHDLDYFCCICNNYPSKYIAKYEFNGMKKAFKLWFTDLAGNPVNVEHFLLDLLLIY